MKVKVYWKTLALIQSETASKSIGMNMKGLFYPNIRMGKALKESSNETLTRIEITYSATTIAAQAELFDDEFSLRTQMDLGNVHRALNQVKELGWHVPMQELLEEFQQGARTQQLLIVQPTVAAMIYGINAKLGCYTGIWKNT